MSSTPSSIPALIGRWPTIGQFAAEVGCGYEAARQMRRRGSIAPQHWPKLVQAAERRGIKGVTFEALTLAHLAKPSPRLPPKQEAAA